MGLALIVSGCLAGIALLAYWKVVRPYHLFWGATTVERRRTFAGDEYVGRPHLQSTRAITVNAGAERVWPWLVQLGQGRGGFYGYDRLNNLLGCRVRSADRLMTEFQSIIEGEIIRVHPRWGCVVAMVNPGRALVFRAANPENALPLVADESPHVALSLAFILFERDDGTTRLVVRERCECTRPDKRLIMELLSLITFITIRKMFVSVKERVERHAVHVPSRIA
jgi:hypothetical protein